MATLATLLMTVALALPATSMVLRSGERIEVDGPIRQEQGRVIFRADGVLYSVPLSEVDFDLTRAVSENVTMVRGDERMRLKKSKEERDRLLRELEKNHSGTAAPPLKSTPVQRESVEPASNRDEWSWRQAARSYEDEVRHSEEEVQLLSDRIERLRHEISTFISLGYRPNQFSYQTSELQFAIDSLPRAELQVARARRALDQFRDDARRQGVLPGWLR
ncbi:MAG: hypothetical protein ABIP63_03335 [Thermoanaerobaculia bacterium]